MVILDPKFKISDIVRIVDPKNVGGLDGAIGKISTIHTSVVTTYHGQAVGHAYYVTVASQHIVDGKSVQGTTSGTYMPEELEFV